MALAYAKARIGTVLVPRDDDRSGNLTSGEIPPGWVLEPNGRIVPFWYSREGYIIKWAVFWGIFLLFGLYMLIGYLHAKRRIKKGKVPLGYHRWLINRAELARVDPRYAYPQASYTPWPGQPVYMQPMAPPMYDPNRPPMYEGPPGGSKVDPSQQQAEYAPPSGPPPAQLRPERTGTSNPFSDPPARK